MVGVLEKFFSSFNFDGLKKKNHCSEPKNAIKSFILSRHYAYAPDPLDLGRMIFTALRTSSIRRLSGNSAITRSKIPLDQFQGRGAWRGS